MTSRHLLLTLEGFTHASKVMADVSRNEGESFTVTRALVPLKDRALPYLPEVLQVAPLIVPVLLLPDRSATVVPLPSLNPYAATRPLDTAVTVSTKLLLALRAPSLTTMVIVEVPLCAEAGVRVTVRLPPVPPKTMLALGTSVGFDELPVTVRLPAAVSTSPTVNGIAAVGVFEVVV